jgi:NAD-dependent DNA ligase
MAIASLQDVVVVVTGKLLIGTRAEIEQFIVDSGGVVRSSVSSNTQLVIFGEKAGSKLEKAEELGIETISEEAFYKRFGFEDAEPLALEGRVVVVTGKLVIGTRAEIEQFIVDNGGSTRSSVTGKTDLVIFGEKAGSKLEKAEELGIETISEADFYRRSGLD